MLGRMTSTMRWLILLPAGPGALLGGWLGEHLGLRVALGFAGSTAILLSVVARRIEVIRAVKTLPTLSAEAVTPYSAGVECDPVLQTPFDGQPSIPPGRYGTEDPQGE
jgi:hypothetical protein